MAVAMGLLPAMAHAAGTQAGTAIENVASATYTAGPVTQTVTSNTVSFNVDELLDVAVTADDAADVPTAAGASAAVLTFTVTNTGNGSEAFALAATINLGGDDFDPGAAAIWFDTDGNGQFDVGLDTQYVPGAGDPVIAPDSQIRVFVVSTIPAGVANGARAQVALSAAAKTGTGPGGTVFAGAGTDGVDAVVGATTAQDDAAGFYRVNTLSVTLTKSAAVRDPFGGGEAVPGATITYSIVAAVTGTGTAQSLVVTDPIPAGTSYVPGSITLDTAPLTDAGDADAGAFAAGRITVSLGDVAASATRTVTFQVRIQ